MRPGQNKRMRGRNNNGNRKGPNPLTRSYESNGPDVKIRGTAHHIGEKYLQLARDAQSGGDPVMAESYLQHAEHYFRLIAAAQQAQQQAQFGYRPTSEQGDADEEDFDDDFGSSLPDRFASPSERAPVPPPPPPPQPYLDRPPFAERQPQPYDNRQERGDRYEGRGPSGDRQPQENRDRQDNRQDSRQDNRDRPPYEPRERQYDNRRERNGYQDRNQQQGQQDRGDRPPREYDNRNFRNNRPPRDQQQRDQQPRDQQPRDQQPRDQQPRDQQPREYQPRDQQPRESRQPVVDETSNGLPAFITAPTRVMVETEAAPDAPSPIARAPEDGEEAGYHLRPRRRRRTKSEEFGGEADKAPAPDLAGD